MRARIDNRLIHGQIAVNWKQVLKFETVVVVDDQLAADVLNKAVMKMTVRAASVTGYFVSVAHALTLLPELAKQNQPSLFGNAREDKLFIVCRTPETLRQLVEGGVAIDEVTIWNMYMHPGKQRMASSVYMDEQDLQAIAAIKRCGTEVAIQETPRSKKIIL